MNLKVDVIERFLKCRHPVATWPACNHSLTMTLLLRTMLQTVTTLKTLAPFTVLICDDRDDNIRQISALSQLLGCHVTTAINGQEAVKYCQNQKFDAILMDLVMPGMSGLEAARAIHSAESPNKATPIIAVTADEDPIVKAGCSSFGIDYYMTKPIKESTLHRILSECQAKL